MLKQKIKYTNFNGQEVEDEFYFHLSKSELVELQFGENETLSDVLEQIIRAENKGGLIALVKRLVLAAYGRKSADGSEFEKSAELREKFSHTAAFQEFFMSLLESEDKLDAFVRGIMPAGFVESMNKAKDQDKPDASAQPRPVSAIGAAGSDQPVKDAND